MIIAAYAGTGKTTLANMYPDKIVDFVAMPYKYHLEQGIDSAECEKLKASYGFEMLQESWPANYVSAIKEALGYGKILLIPSSRLVLRYLENENIPYTLCYPQRDAKEVYRQRFLDRGNTNGFLEIFIDGWDNFMDSLESDTFGKHIVMQPHQFLSDVVSLPN